MKRLFRNIIYQSKNAYREKSFIFWSLFYPLLMALFFYIAFNGMLDREMEDIDVGISDNNPMTYILEEIEILNLYSISEGEVDERLENGDIIGYIDDDLNLLVSESGLNQTIIKEILDQIIQIGALNVPLENMDLSMDYIIGRNQPADPIVIIFYALIAMVSTYSIYTGIEVVSLIQANQSEVGKRINITPLRKGDFIIAGVIVALILNILSNSILLLFIKYVLGINLFTELMQSLIFIFFGNLFGVGLGLLLGVISKHTSNVKTIFGVAITLFLAFLSGLMSPNIKVLIDNNIPIINKLNPVAIITDNLYKINLLGITDNVNQSIITIGILSIILILASYGLLRRKTYDSI